MQMFAGHNAADSIDLSTIEGRTAASKRLAMLQEHVSRLAVAAKRARATGNMAEAGRCQHEMQEMGRRMGAIENALRSSSPLAGLGAFGSYNQFGTAMTYNRTADAELKLKRESLDKATDALRQKDAEIAGLVKQVRGNRAALDKAGALSIGKKSYLKGEIEELEKKIARAGTIRKDLLKKQEAARKEYEKALALARAPGKVVDNLEDKIADLKTQEARHKAGVDAAEKKLKDLKADLAKAGALSLAKKSYIKDEIERYEKIRRDQVKFLEQVRGKIRDLSGDLGKAKVYERVADQKADAAQGRTSVQLIKPGTFRMQAPAGTIAVTDIKTKVKVEGLNKQIAGLHQDMRELSGKIKEDVVAGKDGKGILILIQNLRGKSDSLRDVTYTRDVIIFGPNGARANRARADQARITATEIDIKQVEASRLPAGSKAALLAKLKEHLMGARGQLGSSQKAIASIAAGRVKTLPKLRQINPSALSNQKRQLALKPTAKAPDSALIALLAREFASAVPPIKGESPESYVLRLKRYVARGAIVAANTQTEGKSTAEAVKAAVKDVVVQDAPAIEEEARLQVSAPAGEQAVATTVNAAEAAIVQAAVEAAPEAMAEAPPPSESVAADIIAAPADANATPATASEVVAKLEAASAEGTADQAAVAAASEGEDEKPWYARPSGMVLIGVAALIGYKALTSRE